MTHRDTAVQIINPAIIPQTEITTLNTPRERPTARLDPMTLRSRFLKTNQVIQLHGIRLEKR